MQMVFTTENFLEVAVEIWSEWDLNPRSLNSIHIYIYIQWLCGNSCTSAHDVRLHIDGTNEPKSAQQAKQGACLL